MNKLLKYKTEYDRIAKVFFVLLIILVVFTRVYPHNANDQSRIATIESLVINNTWNIDDSHFGNLTVDKVKYENKLYSSKPFTLSLMGAGVFYCLHNYFNLDFYTPNIKNAYYWLTLFIIGGTFFLLLWYFYLATRWFKLEVKHRLFLTSILAFGTLYLPYSTTFNNHTVAGTFIFVSFFYYLKNKFKEGVELVNLFLSGFFVAWALVIDIPVGSIFLLVFLILNWFIIKEKVKIIFYVLGTLPFIALQTILNYIIFKSFFHVYVDSRTIEVINYWFNPVGIDALHQNKIVYLFNMFFGTHGIFLYMPILLLVFYAIYKIIKEKNVQLHREAILILIAFFGLTFFYLFTSANFGGLSYGFRYYIAIFPMLIYLLVYLFPPLDKAFKFKKIIFILFLVSVLFSGLGLLEVYNCRPFIMIGEGEWAFFPLLYNFSLLFELIQLI